MRIDPEHFKERGEILKLHNKQPAFFRLGKSQGTKDWIQIENAASSNSFSTRNTQTIQIHKETLKTLLEKIEPPKSKENFDDLYQKMSTMSVDEQENLLNSMDSSEAKNFFCLIFAYLRLKNNPEPLSPGSFDFM